KMTVHARGLIPIERIDDIDDDNLGTGVSDHGELDGLDGDDHTQYVLADGTRAFTGDVKIGSDGGGNRTQTIYSGTSGDFLSLSTSANVMSVVANGGNLTLKSATGFPLVLQSNN